MGDKPRNAASDLVHQSVGWWNDRDLVVREGHTLVTPDFVRYDHRRITAQPPVGAQGFFDAFLLNEETAGEWPRHELREIVAVRGERAVLAHWVRYLGGFELEMMIASVVDREGERFVSVHLFDPEDVELAMAELNRLHAEIRCTICDRCGYELTKRTLAREECTAGGWHPSGWCVDLAVAEATGASNPRHQ